MEYKITNGGKFGQALPVRGGLAVIKPGATEALTLARDLDEGQIAGLAAKGVTITRKDDTPKRRSRKADAEEQQAED